MSDIKLDNDRDLLVEGNDLQLITGADDITQNLRQRLSFFFKEWFLDKSKGVPYFEYIFKKKVSVAIVDSVFKREIINTPGVLKLMEFEILVDAALRELTLTFRALTSEGIIDFSEVVP